MSTNQQSSLDPALDHVFLTIVDTTNLPPPDHPGYDTQVRSIMDELLRIMDMPHFHSRRSKLAKYISKFMKVDFSLINPIWLKATHWSTENWYKWWNQFVTQRKGDLIRYKEMDENGNEIDIDWHEARLRHPPPPVALNSATNNNPPLPVQILPRPPGPPISRVPVGSRRVDTAGEEEEESIELPEDDAARETRYFEMHENDSIGNAMQWNRPSFSTLSVFRPPPHQNFTDVPSIRKAVYERTVLYARHCGRLPSKAEEDSEEDKEFCTMLLNLHDKVWDHASPDLQAALAVYNLPYDPRGILKLLDSPFNRRDLLASKAIYIKASVLPFDTFRRVINTSTNYLTKSYGDTALAAISEDWTTTPFPIYPSESDRPRAPSLTKLKSSNPLTTTPSPPVASAHGGYTLRSPATRLHNDVHEALAHPRRLFTTLEKAATEERYGDMDNQGVRTIVKSLPQKEEDALDSQKSCVIMIPVAPLHSSAVPRKLRYSEASELLPIEVAEFYAAGLGANSFSSNIALPGPSGLTSVVRVEKLITDEKLLHRVKSISSLETQDQALTVVGLHSSPGVNATAGDIFLVPKSRYLNNFAQQVYGPHVPIVWDRRKLKEEEKRGFAFISSDLHTIPKTRGEAYKHKFATCKKYTNQSVFVNDPLKVTVIPIILFSLPAVEFFAELAEKDSSIGNREFSRLVYTTGAVVKVGNDVCIIVGALTWLNSYNNHIEGSPHSHLFATALVSALTLASEIGRNVLSKIGPGTLIDEATSISQDVLKESYEEMGGLGELLRFSIGAFAILTRPLVQPLTSIEALTRGLANDGYRIAEGDFATWHRLLAIGFNGDTSLRDHVLRLQHDVRSPPIGVVTTLHQAFNIRAGTTRGGTRDIIEGQLYLILFETSQDPSDPRTLVKVVALGSEGSTPGSAMQRSGVMLAQPIGRELGEEVDRTGNLTVYLARNSSAFNLFFASVANPEHVSPGNLYLGLEGQRLLLPSSTSSTVAFTCLTTLHHPIIAGVLASHLRRQPDVQPFQRVPDSLARTEVLRSTTNELNNLNHGNLPPFSVTKVRNWIGYYGKRVKLRETLEFLLSDATQVDKDRDLRLARLENSLLTLLEQLRRAYVDDDLLQHIETNVGERLLRAQGRYTQLMVQPSIECILKEVEEDLAEMGFSESEEGTEEREDVVRVEE